MRRPENAGELEQFENAVNWMRTALPNLSEAEAPLRSLLQECLAGTTRTRRVASRRVIANEQWTQERLQAWDHVRDLVTTQVRLYHPQSDRSVLMFLDASNRF